MLGAGRSSHSLGIGLLKQVGLSETRSSLFLEPRLVGAKNLDRVRFRAWSLSSLLPRLRLAGNGDRRCKKLPSPRVWSLRTSDEHYLRVGSLQRKSCRFAVKICRGRFAWKTGQSLGGAPWLVGIAIRANSDAGMLGTMQGRVRRPPSCQRGGRLRS